MKIEIWTDGPEEIETKEEEISKGYSAEVIFVDKEDKKSKIRLVVMPDEDFLSIIVKENIKVAIVQHKEDDENVQPMAKNLG